ncbi:MAG: 5'-nucleotidase C-terminal domain-containing protein [Firmicutes bacterium]|nr:5'-nucleotidase C-terminal domain-containing protein [Bacillota bacterium]
MGCVSGTRHWRRLAVLALVLAAIAALAGTLNVGGLVAGSLAQAQSAPAVATQATTVAPTPSAATSADLVIAATSDLHGTIDPIDYYTGQPSDGGLAQISTLVKQLRAQSPNLLLLDNGDTIEGGDSVMAYHFAFDPAAPNPMAVVMNALGYDAASIGNHEFNYGKDALQTYIQEAHYPVLSANVADRSGRRVFVPYVIKDFGNFKVGILGLTTPKVPTWEKPANIAGWQFEDPVAVAKRYVAEMKANGADVIVLLEHSGFEKAPAKGANSPATWSDPATQWASTQSDDENFTLRLANEVPGVDVIVAGHQHYTVPQLTDRPGLVPKGVLVTEPGAYGQYLSVIRLRLERTAPDQPWHVASASSQVESAKGVAPDPQVEQLAKYYNDQTWAYFTQPIGQALGDMPGGLQARFHDNALVQLINAAQLWASGADISLAALFSERSFIKKGPITIQDVYRLYVYPNTLYKIQITGDQLRKALEWDARYFKTYEGQTRLADLVNPLVPGYNWDIYAGIEYKLDLRKPVGQRVVELKYKGQDVRPDQVFTLAVNNYRGGGGGGFDMFRGAPVLWQSTKEVREILVDYIRQVRQVDPNKLVTNNWQLLPDVVSNLPE